MLSVVMDESGHVVWVVWTRCGRLWHKTNACPHVAKASFLLCAPVLSALVSLLLLLLLCTALCCSHGRHQLLLVVVVQPQPRALQANHSGRFFFFLPLFFLFPLCVTD